MNQRGKWNRISGNNRNSDISLSLQARIADPYWLLFRQFQSSAFQGEDAATPIHMEVKYVSLPIGQLNESPIDSTQSLRSCVEKEDMFEGRGRIRSSGEAGLALLRKAPVDKRAGLLRALQNNEYSIPDDVLVEDDSYYLFLKRKSFDAFKFHSEANQTVHNTIIQESNMDPVVYANLMVTWNACISDKKRDVNRNAWNNEKLQYQFSIKTEVKEGVEIALDAQNCYGGTLDWSHFRVRPSTSQNLGREFQDCMSLSLLPTRVKYAGMPEPTYWQFEEGKIYFGRLLADKSDLFQSLITEFFSVYSNDWYMFPVPVESGSLTRVQSIIVYDSFGDIHSIKPTAVVDHEKMNRTWKFIELSEDVSPQVGFSPWVFIPFSENSVSAEQDVERVIFTRDEYANLIWAEEVFVESESGHKLVRHDHWRKLIAEKPPERDPILDQVDDKNWLFQFTTDVPPYKIPFLVTDNGKSGEHYVQRSRLPHWKLLEEHKTKLVGAKGRLIGRPGPCLIEQNEILTNGIELSRKYHVARTLSGELLLWGAKKKTITTDVKSSAAFDTDIIVRGT